MQVSADGQVNTHTPSPRAASAANRAANRAYIQEAVLARVTSEQKSYIAITADVDIPGLGHCEGACDTRVDRLAGRAWVSGACKAECT